MRKLIFIISLLITYNVSAQEEIITDRPDQTESASVVPVNGIQYETGFALEMDETASYEVDNYIYNSSLFRIGVFENTEFRVGLGYSDEKYMSRLTDMESSLSGLSPLHTGLKVKMTEEKGFLPEMALLASLDWPVTASRDMDPGNVVPAIRMAFAHTLSERFSLGYNLGTEWDGVSSEAAYFYSVALGAGLTERLGLFVESYGYFMESDENIHQFDAGFTYLVEKNFQLDVSGGVGLSENAPDSFVSFGFSYLFVPKN